MDDLDDVIDKYDRNRERKERAKPTTSFFIHKDAIYEQVRKDKLNLFVGCDKNGKMLHFLSHDYDPIDDEIIDKGGVLLSEEPEEYGDEAKLIEDIQTHVRKYLDIEEEYLEYATYYILLTWVYDRITTIPYLRALGDTGTGKSRFLEVLGNLCYKPMKIAGTVTPAPIYRLIERWKGTLIIDEADRDKSDTTDEIIKILNCGYERGKPVIRCDKEDPNKVEAFDAFGPKILCSRYPFFDKALESRCITYKTRETKRNDIPPILPPSFYENEKHIRNKLLMFRLKNWFTIDPNILEDMSKFGLDGIEPRLKQTATPFLILFKQQDLKNRFLTFIRKYNEDLISERSESDEGRIVNTLNDMDVLNNSITPTELADKINENYKLRDKAMVNARKIGRLLRSLNISVVSRRIGEVVKRVIEPEPELWKNILCRYNLEFWEKIRYDVTNVTLEMGEGGKNNNRRITTDKQTADDIPSKEGVSITCVTNVTSVTEKDDFVTFINPKKSLTPKKESVKDDVP